MHGSRTEPWFGGKNAGQVFAKDENYNKCWKRFHEVSVANLITLKYKIFCVFLFQYSCKQNYFLIRWSRLIPGKIVTSVLWTKTEFNNFKSYQLTTLLPLQAMPAIFCFLLRKTLKILWKMLFISSKKFFLFSRYSNLYIFPPSYAYFQIHNCSDTME